MPAVNASPTSVAIIGTGDDRLRGAGAAGAASSKTGTFTMRFWTGSTKLRSTRTSDVLPPDSRRLAAARALVSSGVSPCGTISGPTLA